jgi:hypothetical protein
MAMSAAAPGVAAGSTESGLHESHPPPDFDPLAPGADLARYFLPPRPDRRHTPLAYASWVEALAPRPQFPPKAPSIGVQQIAAAARPQPNQTITQESSRNWSGASVRSGAGDAVSLVQGRWTVPGSGVPQGDLPAVSSIWVGLDGHDPATRIMPQIGTMQAAIQGEDCWQSIAFPWWQIWLRGDAGSFLRTIPLMVGVGDSVYAQVQALGRTVVSFLIRNETANTAWAGYYFLDPECRGARPLLERRTAEWVVERPFFRFTDNQPLMLLPFAAYGETAFAACNAAAERNGAMREFQLDRADLIRMNLWDDAQHRGHLASLPARQGDDGLLMRYVAPPRP